MHTLILTLEIRNESAKEILKLESGLLESKFGPAAESFLSNCLLQLKPILAEESASCSEESSLEAHSVDILWDDDIPLDFHSAEACIDV